MITVRLPTETYAYIEVTFNTIEEYEREYPKFVASVLKTRLEAKKIAERTKDPF